MPKVFRTTKELHLLMDAGYVAVVPAGIQLVEENNWYRGKSKKITGRYQDHLLQKSVVEKNQDWFKPL